MFPFINIISCFFDGLLLYIYFQSMFEKRRNFPLSLVVAVFVVTAFLFGATTSSLSGNVSHAASIGRSLLNDICNFSLSFFFLSPLAYRALVVIIYSIIISICENLSFFIITHFTDTTIVLDQLPEITFTSIALLSDLLILIVAMLISATKTKRSNVQSRIYSFLLLLTPFLSCILTFLPSFFRLNKTDPEAYLILALFLLIINIVNYVLLQNVLCTETLTRETKMLEKQVEAQKQKYLQLGDSYKNLRSFMHDTKKHLFYIETCVNKEQYDRIIPYTREMMSDLETRYCTVNTGNLVIDAFVSDLILRTKRYKIRLLTSIKADFTRIPDDTYHLTIILGNLFDNAINACKDELDAEINLKIQTVEHVFVIYITNTYHYPMNQRRPKTFDDMDFIHGYGLQNVKNSAKAKDGFCRIDYANDIYSVMVVLPERTN